MLTAVKTKYPWEIEKNYRRCFAKSYKVHVCRPPRGVLMQALIFFLLFVLMLLSIYNAAR